MSDTDDVNIICSKDCEGFRQGYQSIFRHTKSVMKQKLQSTKKTAPKSSSKYLSIFDYNSPRDSLTTSFASTGIYSPPSNVFIDEEENDEVNKNDHVINEEAPSRIPLSERRDLHSNIADEHLAIIAATPKTNTGARWEYSPSPLSIVSSNFGGGIVVLISGDPSMIDENEDKSIQLLRSSGMRCHIVDAMNPSQSKTRKDLVFVSGIMGHYPQIFYVDNHRKASYIGNHESIFALENEGRLNQLSLAKFAKEDSWNSVTAGSGPDSSFFSV